MLATVASSTSANRIKRRLSESGIHSYVIQTPQQLAREGCGYSLRFDESNMLFVEKASYDLGIKIRAFYSEITEVDGKRYIKV